MVPELYQSGPYIVPKLSKMAAKWPQNGPKSVLLTNTRLQKLQNDCFFRRCRHQRFRRWITKGETKTKGFVGSFEEESQKPCFFLWDVGESTTKPGLLWDPVFLWDLGQRAQNNNKNCFCVGFGAKGTQNTLGRYQDTLLFVGFWGGSAKRPCV